LEFSKYTYQAWHSTIPKLRCLILGNFKEIYLPNTLIMRSSTLKDQLFDDLDKPCLSYHPNPKLYFEVKNQKAQLFKNIRNKSTWIPWSLFLRKSVPKDYVSCKRHCIWSCKVMVFQDPSEHWTNDRKRKYNIAVVYAPTLVVS
jgi:hypothetical protein